MFIFTEDNELLNIERFHSIDVKDNEIVAYTPDDYYDYEIIGRYENNEMAILAIRALAQLIEGLYVVPMEGVRLAVNRALMEKDKAND